MGRAPPPDNNTDTRDMGENQALLQPLQPGYNGAVRNQRSQLALALIGLVLALLVARVAVTVLSTLDTSNRAAIWASDHCGLYRFDSDGAGEEAAARADVYDRAQETRAGDYVKYYCNPTTSTLLSRCDFFYEAKIEFNTTHQFHCPLFKKDICVQGSPAVTFDTGFVDANSIGIDDPYGYKFHRSATCTP